MSPNLLPVVASGYMNTSKQFLFLKDNAFYLCRTLKGVFCISLTSLISRKKTRTLKQFTFGGLHKTNSYHITLRPTTPIHDTLISAAPQRNITICQCRVMQRLTTPHITPRTYVTLHGATLHAPHAVPHYAKQLHTAQRQAMPHHPTSHHTLPHDVTFHDTSPTAPHTRQHYTVQHNFAPCYITLRDVTKCLTLSNHHVFQRNATSRYAKSHQITLHDPLPCHISRHYTRLRNSTSV